MLKNIPEGLFGGLHFGIGPIKAGGSLRTGEGGSGVKAAVGCQGQIPALDGIDHGLAAHVGSAAA